MGSVTCNYDNKIRLQASRTILVNPNFYLRQNNLKSSTQQRKADQMGILHSLWGP